MAERADRYPSPVRPFALGLEGLTLSGLLAEPEEEPRALIVALHGHGMTSQYFAGPADRASSLLELGAAIGFTVWAPDRPGYGAAHDADPAWFPMLRQAELLAAAIDVFAEEHAVGMGCVLLGHSFGFKLAIAIAGSPPKTRLLGIEGSGTGVMYAFEPGVRPPRSDPGDVGPAWGPAHLYPAEMFERGVGPMAPIAPPPAGEAAQWVDDVRRIGPEVRVPVRFTLGDHDRLWTVSVDHFHELDAIFTASPAVSFDVQRSAGHNVSLGKTARAYHLKALAFAEDCLTLT
jgi:pimeloyl-ACP methyl ester carboxylesterase